MKNAQLFQNGGLVPVKTNAVEKIAIGGVLGNNNLKHIRRDEIQGRLRKERQTSDAWPLCLAANNRVVPNATWK